METSFLDSFMKVTSIGRSLALKLPMDHGTLVWARTIPGVKKWHGSLLVVPPTREIIDQVRDRFPQASWDPTALQLESVLEKIEKSVIQPPLNIPSDYSYGTKPFAHQEEVFQSSRDRTAYALFMEQGTGKTKVILDTACYLWSQGKILGLLVVAYPNGVHENWVNNEIPVHVPNWCPVVSRAWQADRGEKKIEDVFQDSPTSVLRILSVNVEALSTRRGEEVCRKFLNSYPSLMVVDESTSIKKISAKRSKACIRLGHLAPYRRLMTGTPVTSSQLNLYSQFQFLDEDILGFSTFYSFRARYAVLRPLPGRFIGNSKRQVEVVVGYQHTEELQEKIQPHSYRKLKRDCLDLPEKLYGDRIQVQLTDEQQNIYEQFTEELLAEFKGRTITAELAMTRMLRHHQVVCGFMSPENEEDFGEPIGDINPRLTALMDHIDTSLPWDPDTKKFDTDAKALIWANYRFSIREVVGALERKYGPGVALPFSGKTPVKLRPGIVSAFQDPLSKVRFLVGNKAMAYGWTLTKGIFNYYYCNFFFDLEARLQSEDRSHRIGQWNPVTYFDVEVPGTIDSTIIKRFRENYEISSTLLGDELKEWLCPKK